jgi:hypothetical protein
MRVRQRLLRAFLELMTQRQPDWTGGADCGGVLSWELHSNQFSHRHCGYTQHFFAYTRCEEDSSGNRCVV